MNVIKDLLDSSDATNRKLARQMIYGIFRNALCELITDNFGTIDINQPYDFSGSCMLELTTVHFFYKEEGSYVVRKNGNQIMLFVNDLMRKVDYEESQIKQYIEEYLLNAEVQNFDYFKNKLY